ncbi:MAG: hypothetical protein HPY57_15455 [Ignavibacteria bacterium]|nr:hypothetical protein [Ignavibacteria bacterium]
MLLISKALEQYSRMICGQMSHWYIPSIEHALHKEHYNKYKEENPDDADNAMTHMCKVRDKVDYHLEEIKKLIWTELKDNSSAHYGIGYDKESDLAYEIYKCILHHIEVEEMKRCKETGEKYNYNVHSGTPLHITDVPHIKVDTIDTREIKLKRIIK